MLDVGGAHDVSLKKENVIKVKSRLMDVGYCPDQVNGPIQNGNTLTSIF